MDRHFATVAKILWKDWDPIGVRMLGGPDDEYDFYVDGIIALLRKGTTETEVSSYLQAIATEAMGLDTDNTGHHAARKLLAPDIC